jgi:hypothetical protein
MRNQDWSSIERYGVGLTTAVALLIFFPLITFQVPIIGNQNVTGYEMFSKAQEFRNQVASSSNSTNEGDVQKSPTDSRYVTATDTAHHH